MYIKRKNFQSLRVSNRKSSKSSNKRPLIWIIIALAAFLFVTFIWVFWWFYSNIVKKLPPISDIDNINFSQATIITDRNNVVLYKLFEENRTYVWFEKISKNMVNAIIATEDKNFWTNPWIDISWIVRAWLKDIMHLEKKQWASTITQQLIKDLLLSREKTITRKLKEAVLAFQINSYIENQLKAKHQNLSNDELDRKSKEKIMELYLNHIFLWNNAYWIEAASKLYFWTSAQNLWILESSILAWIPQAPSKYNPYTNKETIMWQLIVRNFSWDEIKPSIELKKEIISKIKTNSDWTTSAFVDNQESFANLLEKITKTQIEFSWELYSITYERGRKDWILGRMIEDKYIDAKQAKQTFLDWLEFEFKYQKIEIKAPHFVFSVINDLKEKYGEEMLMKWWLTIKTSLDYNIQQLAESAINNNMWNIKKQWWSNASLIYLDSRNWDILGYVWSSDFNNKEIDWQVDMIQSLRQPWSTVKPFLYSLWFMENKLTIDSPIYDIPMTIWWDNPENSDWNYDWLTSIKRALAWSRNIPAIKMYFSIWEDKEVIKFFKKLWVNSFSSKIDYGYPLAMWWWEVRMKELANAYMHLSAQWQPAEIDPVLEIRNSNWSIIYKKNVTQQEQVIPSWVAYMIWKILSDKNNLPSSWVANYTFEWLKMATKSWTTDVKLKNGKQLPRDWWLAVYTPSKVWIFWAWNTKWEPLNKDAYGGWLNSKIRKEFFKSMLTKWYIKDEDMEEKEVKEVYVSKLSWKIPSDETPSSLIIPSLWYIENLPEEIDGTKTIKIDKACNWIATDETPQEDISTAFMVDINSVLKWTRDTEQIKTWWEKTWLQRYSELLWKSIVISQPNETCDSSKRNISTNDSTKIEILKPINNQNIVDKFSIWYKITSDKKINNIEIYLDYDNIWSYKYQDKQEIIDIKNIELKNISTWKHKIKLIAIDEEWARNSEIISVNIIEKDTDSPSLNKDKISLEKTAEWKYSISVLFEDESSYVKWWTILQDWKTIKEFKWPWTSFEVENTQWITFKVQDWYDNVSEWDIVVKSE